MKALLTTAALVIGCLLIKGSPALSQNQQASAEPRPETSLLCVSDFGMGSGFLPFAFLGDVRKLSSHLCRMRRRRYSQKVVTANPYFTPEEYCWRRTRGLLR